MKLTNQVAQTILLALILIYVGGFFFVNDWLSYLIGSFIMYVMCSLVLNKMKAEVKELSKNE